MSPRKIADAANSPKLAVTHIEEPNPAQFSPPVAATAVFAGGAEGDRLGRIYGGDAEFPLRVARKPVRLAQAGAYPRQQRVLIVRDRSSMRIAVGSALPPAPPATMIGKPVCRHQAVIATFARTWSMASITPSNPPSSSPPAFSA